MKIINKKMDYDKVMALPRPEIIWVNQSSR